MTPEEIVEELEKCKESPYYFFTHYWQIDGKAATTRLTEEEFNKTVKDWQEGNLKFKIR